MGFNLIRWPGHKNWSYFSFKIQLWFLSPALLHVAQNAWICIVCYGKIFSFSHPHEFLKCSLGFLDIKKVDILWNNQSKVKNSYNGSSGELYLRATMSSEGNGGRFWGVLINHCHKIMQIIDWTRSHPDNINHFSSAYGIDAGWQYFLNVCMN